MANGLPYKQLVTSVFGQLSQQGPEKFPSPGALAHNLRKRIKGSSEQFYLNAVDAALFGSAAVEMWLRAVHSFLISTSVMKASPVWSAVSGYYSSHYVMRGFSHLFGRFLLGRDRQVVQMTLSHGKYSCDVAQKRNLLEHQYYWELPHGEFGVAGNALFSKNPPIKNDSEKSDGFHRVFANYFDHVDRFPDFTPLDELFLRERVNRVSELVTDSLAIPDHTKFPDLDAVHVIAYARIVNFRNFLDNVIDTNNRYWRFYRKPSWFLKYMDFQMSESKALTSDNIPS